MDFFDCVMPARNARHARLFTWEGAINLKNAKYITDDSPIDPHCDCPVCRRYSRAYIRHLFVAEEMLAMRLSVMHNLYFYNKLMEKIRQSLDEGRFEDFRWSVELEQKNIKILRTTLKASITINGIMNEITQKGVFPMNVLTGTTSAGMGSTVIMLVLMIAIFYFMLIRPENKRKKEAEQMRGAVKKGDKIVTIGGIVGVVVDVKESRIVVETSADQVRIELEKWAISSNETATGGHRRGGERHRRKPKRNQELQRKPTRRRRTDCWSFQSL